MSQKRGSKRNRTDIKDALKKRQKVRRRNKDDLYALLDWFLPEDRSFADLGLHGNTKWRPRCLIALAVIWAWSESKNVTDAFVESLETSQKLSFSAVPGTYQGFMGALSTRTPDLLLILFATLQQRMEEIGGSFWRVNGWVPIAFDGSRSTAPRTNSNEKAFCAPNYGNGQTARYRNKQTKGTRRKRNEKKKAASQEPQVWITLMWHMGLRLPWSWELGPSNSSERAHVMEMICSRQYPEKTLFCGDAGFVGFPLWSTIIKQGGDFLVRVGANVKLLSETMDIVHKKDGLVLCWPKGMQSTEPPLRLRLVKVRIGKTDMFMLTSVLDRKLLTKKQIVKLYEMRWGIEVEFRGLKQTLDRAKLRCRNDQRLLAELNWSIMAMAIAEVLALKHQLNKRATKSNPEQAPDPKKRSLANTIRALRNCLRHLNDRPQAGHDLPTALSNAMTDNYKRPKSKRARYRPPNPDKKPLGEPAIRKLSEEETKKMRKMEEKIAA